MRQVIVHCALPETFHHFGDLGVNQAQLSSQEPRFDFLVELRRKMGLDLSQFFPPSSIDAGLVTVTHPIVNGQAVIKSDAPEQAEAFLNIQR